jgi:hypothetical protein
MLTPLQHMHCKERWNQRRTKWAVCVQRIRNADSSATHCTAKLEVNWSKPGICVRGSMLTPLQHNALQSAAISAEQTMAAVSEDQEC